MQIEKLRTIIENIAEKYALSKVTLFGSRAAGTNGVDSDVDLIVEFKNSVSLLTLSALKNELEELLGLAVDVIHGPITENDMIIIDDEVILYAA